MSSQIYRFSPQTPRDPACESPRLRYLTAAQYNQDWNSAMHTHTCTELFFITGGHGLFHMNEKVFPIAVNDVVVVSANVPHTELSQTANPLSYIVLGVDGMEVMPEFGDCTMIHLTGQQTKLSVCLDLLLEEAREQADGWEDICQNLLEILLRRLVRNKDLSLSAATATSTKSNRECELVRRYIDNHFKENLRLDDLAALAHINKYYLSHTFQKEFGISPISYLISRRIQESRYLLSDTDHTLSQIAHILGFSSLSYFSQSFRRMEGISPMEYRRQCRRSMTPQGGTT